MTVTSQHNDLPLCQGTSVRPSGLFPSVRNNPDGSFVTGVPVNVNVIIIILNMERKGLIQPVLTRVWHSLEL